MKDLIKQANARLKDQGIQLRIVHPKGRNKIYVRGNLPPRPDSEKTEWRRQTIALESATLEGVAMGERKIKHMAIQLSLGEFTWENSPVKVTQSTVSNWIEKYKKYVESHVISGSPQFKEEQWYVNYLYGGLVWLPQQEPLSQEAIVEGINHYPPNSSGRQKAIQTYRKFCQFCNLDIDFTSYRGRIKPIRRDLKMVLEDDELHRAYKKFDGCWTWQTTFGVMATYGLRNHEIFFCTLEVDKGDVVAIVEEHKPDIDGSPKTGSRVVLPLYDEWARQWKLLENFKRPNVKAGTTVKRLGNRVASAFRTKGFAYPYRCRISYAVRGTCRERIPIPVMARLMGHSPATHLKKYQRYFPGDMALDVARDILRERSKNIQQAEDF